MTCSDPNYVEKQILIEKFNNIPDSGYMVTALKVFIFSQRIARDFLSNLVSTQILKILA